MDLLDGEDAGLFKVTTESAVYVIDLDRMLLTRTADEPTAPLRRLRSDEEPIQLVQLARCSIGEAMHLDIKLCAPAVIFTRRTTTTVLDIQALTSPSPRPFQP